MFATQIEKMSHWGGGSKTAIYTYTSGKLSGDAKEKYLRLQRDLPPAITAAAAVAVAMALIVET